METAPNNSPKGTARRSYAHLIYALISFACPVLAAVAIHIYQEIAYADFWQPKASPVEDDSHFAEAMLAIAIVIEAFFAIVVGSLVGLIFAGVSLKKRFRLISFGTAAFLFNGVPIAFFVYKMFSGW